MPWPFQISLAAMIGPFLQSVADHVLHVGPLFEQFPQGPADRSRRGNIEQLSRPVVGEENALVRIDGDDPLFHAAEHGPQLLAILLELAKTGAARRELMLLKLWAR